MSGIDRPNSEEEDRKNENVNKVVRKETGKTEMLTDERTDISDLFYKVI